MPAPTRPYLFYGATQALCATCLRVVSAKEIIEGERVYLLKLCPTHGSQRVLNGEPRIDGRDQGRHDRVSDL